MERTQKVVYALGVIFGAWLVAVGGTYFYQTAILPWWGDVTFLAGFNEQELK